MFCRHPKPKVSMPCLVVIKKIIKSWHRNTFWITGPLWGESTGAWFNIKMTSYQYRKSHCGDKTILRPSYLHNGISYTGKTASLYWIRALALCEENPLVPVDSAFTSIMWKFDVYFHYVVSLNCWAVEQTVNLTLIWDPFMLMWHHYNGYS